jgi:hypothetical protein
VLRHIQDYRLLFQILAEDNKGCIPPVNDKQFGLIKLFGMYLNKAFFSKTRARMNKESYDTIYEFLDEFSDVVLSYHQYYKKYLTIPDELPFVATNKSSFSYAKHNKSYAPSLTVRKPANVSYQKSSQEPNMDRRISNVKSNTLMHSQALPEYDNSENDDLLDTEQIFFNYSDGESNESEDELPAASQPLMPTSVSNSSYNISHDQTSASLDLNATNSVPPKQVCISMVLNGKCKYLHDADHTQKFSHDMQLVIAKRQEYASTWKDPQQLTDKKPSDPITRILKR